MQLALASPVVQVGQFLYGTLVTAPTARGRSQQVLYRMTLNGKHPSILWKWTKGSPTTAKLQWPSNYDNQELIG